VQQKIQRQSGLSFSDVMEVSVKWWCKRLPAVQVTASAWQTLHGAKPNKNTDC